MHDVPQLVHLGIVARPDDAAVLEVGGRVVPDGRPDAGEKIAQRVDVGSQLLQQRRRGGLRNAADLGQGLTGIPQGTDLPGCGGTVQDTGGQALDVKHPAQGFLEIPAGHVLLVEGFHRVQAGVDGRRVHQGLLDPGAEQALAHGSLGLVQHPEQGALFLPAAHGLGEFQVGPGHRGKAHVLGVGVVLHRTDALDAVLLGLLEVAQQHAHRVGHHAVLGKAAGLAPVRPELGGQLGVDDAVLAAGVLPQFHQGAGVLLDVGRHVLEVQHGGVDEDLAGHVAAELGDDGAAHLFGGEFGGVGLAGRDVGKADARPPAAALLFQVDGAEVVVLVLGQHAALNDGAGGHHPDDVPLDQAFGQGGVLHLLTDGHLVSLGDQPGHIGLVGMEGHAAHGGALLPAAVFAGQRQLQFPGCGEGIVVEHLIKVAHTIKENLVRVLLLDLKVLLHHGRNCLFRHVSHSCSGPGPHPAVRGNPSSTKAGDGLPRRNALYPPVSGSRSRTRSCRCSRPGVPGRSWGRRRSWRC